ncbi:MAG: hypothetical protein LQ339_007486 [Xanthoria mediterranea]|nr:MAG: hypothetical protein LQ339_007486 [Xanthoria mediterranea]
MSNRSFFDGSDSGDSGEDDLPYPKPLARSAFLTPEFNPHTYLSTLRNRHQTLEDLRTDLRSRSQEISKELLDLVNENYEDFLSLGSSLRGGEEKIEEVRLGLLGFQRDVEGVKAIIDGRRKETEALINQRKEIRRQMQVGRALLDINQRLCELEQSLMMTTNGSPTNNAEPDIDHEISDSGEESDEGQGGGMSISRLTRHTQQYLLAQQIMKRVGSDHPFVVRQEARMTKVKNTILLDVGNALKQAGGQDTEYLMKILAIYRDLGEYQEASKVLKQRKP